MPILVSALVASVGGIALALASQAAVAPSGFSFVTYGPTPAPDVSEEAVVSPLLVVALVLLVAGAGLFGALLALRPPRWVASRLGGLRVAPIGGIVALATGVALIVWQVQHFMGGWYELVTAGSGQIGVSIDLPYPVVMSGGVFGPAAAGLVLALVGILLTSAAVVRRARLRSAR